MLNQRGLGLIGGSKVLSPARPHCPSGRYVEKFLDDSVDVGRYPIAVKCIADVLALPLKPDLRQ